MVVIAVANHALQAQGYHDLYAIWTYVSYGWRWIIPALFLFYFWAIVAASGHGCNCKNCHHG